MSVPPRGARNRRSGRRPGWQLLTVLLVLAILASSTIVFTNKVELLRLAVVLSLWAAVLAAFVSVVYRRQSELDQARARDMKYVYDLQLDREIAARREYELGVEAHLRRQLTRELRSEAGEEMAALRAELIALRSHLEVLLGTDLGERPALGSDRITADRLTMAPPQQLGRVESSRVTAVISEESLAPETVELEAVAAESVNEDSVSEESITEVTVTEVTITEETVSEFVVTESAVSTVAPETPDVAEPVASESVADESGSAESPAVETPIIDVPEEPLPPAPPAPPFEQPWQSPEYHGSHRRQQGQAAEPAMAPPRPPAPPQPTAPWRPPETAPRRGRHWVPESSGVPEGSGVPEENGAPEPVMATEPPADAIRGRHRDAVSEQDERPTDEGHAQQTSGHSVADLMARLKVDGQVGGGGGRRRRED